MSSGPDAPTVEDPSVTAAKQQQLNTTAGQDSQRGSMVNQNTDYGSLSYTQTGTSPDGTPIYSATTSLSPAQKQLLTTLQGTQQTAGTAAQNLLSGANYGAQQPGDVIGNSTSGLVKDAMAKQVAYLKPQQDADISQLDAKLKNQGFNPGDPGYDKAMNALKQSHGQTITGFESTMEPQMFQQAMQSYLMPAQLGGTLAGFGAPTNPTFQNTPGLNIAPADLVGATANAQKAQQATYDAQMKQNNAMMSGLFGIPTAALGGWANAGGLSSLMGSAALAGV